MPKKGGLGQFADLGGGGGLLRGDGVFEGGADTPMHTMMFPYLAKKLSPPLNFALSSR